MDRPRLFVLLIVAGSCAEHALAVATGRDFPRDMNLAYAWLPPMYAQLETGDWAGFARATIQPGGWYVGLLAAWLRVVGPSGPAFAIVAVMWVGLTIVAAAEMARAWGGPRAGVAAAAVVAQAPAIVMLARTGWVHTPEAALLALGGWALATDPGLARWRTVAALALTGALAVLLRPSGLVWVAILGLSAFRGWRRLAIVATIWAVAALPLVPVVRPYIAGKAGVRLRYAMSVDGLGHQLLFHLGPGGCVLVVIALALAIRARLRPSREAVALLGGWALAALGLYGYFHAGLDNFPLLYVAVAVLAGIALGTTGWAVGAAGVAWAAFVAVTASHDLGPAPPDSSRMVVALLEATCPDRGPSAPCVIVAADGLFAAHPEEPGRLELFLLRQEGVHVRPVGDVPPRSPAPAAMALWTCDERARASRGAGAPKGEMLVRRWDLAEAWSTRFGRCTYRWMTPGGTLAGAVDLPP